MRRWTDGMRWSKSRVEGQFLVYRRIEAEVDQETDENSAKRRRISSVDSISASSTVADDDTLTEDDKNKESKKKEIAMLKSEVEDGSVLCKKTFAISIDGNISHVVHPFDRFVIIARMMLLLVY